MRNRWDGWHGACSLNYFIYFRALKKRCINECWPSLRGDLKPSSVNDMNKSFESKMRQGRKVRRPFCWVRLLNKLRMQSTEFLPHMLWISAHHLCRELQSWSGFPDQTLYLHQPEKRVFNESQEIDARGIAFLGRLNRRERCCSEVLGGWACFLSADAAVVFWSCVRFKEWESPGFVTLPLNDPMFFRKDFRVWWQSKNLSAF